MHAASELIVSDCFLPLPRGQIIDLLETTGEVPKCQTQLAAGAPYGDLDLQSMEPPKTTLQAKYQHSLEYYPQTVEENWLSSPDYDWILECEDIIRRWRANSSKLALPAT